LAATSGPQRVVIAGAGLAGLRTAEELRGQGYPGQITLVGAEAHPPYDRPPLSKKLMTGQLDHTTLREDLSGLDVELRAGEQATALGAGVLHTSAGEHRFDALVLATGATPIRLPGQGRQFVLRTIDDALGLRDLLRKETTLLIVGAGWIGAELATAAASRGCHVTVPEAASEPLANAIGPQAGALTRPWYAEHGVDLRLGQPVRSVEDGGVLLADGSLLAADVVVCAVGVRPAVGWLDGSGIALENGVAVDGQLRTSLAGVFAAGDCAAFESARYGRRLRFEHWDIALHAPAVVAANVLGGSASYDPVPYFWSEQFGRMLQYVGYHGDAARLLLRGDPAAPGWGACWLAGGRLVAMLTVNQPRDLQQGRRLIESGAEVDTDRLADPAVAVRDSAR
jgi:3-phenylpropionate/trans-cinnamate dioxygenase ferredoxin reductase component